MFSATLFQHQDTEAFSCFPTFCTIVRPGSLLEIPFLSDFESINEAARIPSESVRINENLCEETTGVLGSSRNTTVFGAKNHAPHSCLIRVYENDWKQNRSEKDKNREQECKSGRYIVALLSETNWTADRELQRDHEDQSSLNTLFFRSPSFAYAYACNVKSQNYSTGLGTNCWK